jgi:hypothetical protein
MAGVTRHAMRFTAGEDPGPRSGVWKIVTTRDEIYVLPVYAGGEIKTSLHTKGNSRHALSEAAARRFLGGADRAFQKWREPAGECGNLRLQLEVVMPTDELTPAVELTPAEKQKITVLEPAPPTGATVVSLFLLPPGEVVESEGK